MDTKKKLSRKERRELQRKERNSFEKQLRAKGLSRTQSRLVTSSEPVIKLDTKSVNNVRRKSNYQRLIEAGFTPKEADRFKGSNQQLVEEILFTKATPLLPKQIKRQEEAFASYQERMSQRILIFFRDRTESVSKKGIANMQALSVVESDDFLERSIDGWLSTDWGVTPRAEYKIVPIKPSDNLRSIKGHYSRKSYFTLKEVSPYNYRDILEAMNLMLMLLYGLMYKYEFTQQFLSALRFADSPHIDKVRRWL